MNASIQKQVPRVLRNSRKSLKGSKKNPNSKSVNCLDLEGSDSGEEQHELLGLNPGRKRDSHKIIIDNSAALFMLKCNKDTIINRHIKRKFHCVMQGNSFKRKLVSLDKYKILDGRIFFTDLGSHLTFKSLWEIILYDRKTSNFLFFV